MEDEGKIEQFCLLAKGYRGRALADLAHKATSDPSLFAFGELLEVPNIKELQGTEFGAAYELLHLFCYGTWSDYRGQPDRYPKLSAEQELKLKQLTVVSMAQSSQTIPYDDLMRQLEMANVREVEDLLISECFYPRLVKGKLDQQRRLLQVEEAVGRDVRIEQLPAIMEGLSKWLQTTSSLLSTVEAKISWAQQAAESHARKQAEMEAAIEETKNQLRTETDVRGAQDSMLMDDAAATLDFMDEDRTGGRPKRRR